ncbi:hypothetical protein SAMN05720487_102225 [Fibrobacter sp. UWT2]|nr:hypothetical protein SAMN05720487_102225 [Fibrobacter sp. UWT2]
MNQKLYMACAGIFSLAMLACSESTNSPVSGTAEEPNVLTAENDISSSSIEIPASSAEIRELSSSSAEPPILSSSSEIPLPTSSSSEPPIPESSSSSHSILCKTNGGPCGGPGGGDLWFPAYDYDLIQTDRYAEDKSVFGEKAGTWFLETDSSDGGKSTIQWGLEYMDIDWDGQSLIPVIEECDGLCGTFALDKGDLSYDPFITIGFYVAGFDSSGNPLSADVSNWQGICIAFSLSGAPADVQLSMGDSLDEAMGYALPEEVLGKSYGRSSCFEWSDFLQPTWKSKDALTVSGEEAARRLVKVIIRIQGKSGSKGEFIIQGIGTNI